jgi:hypothetical protein
MRERTLQTYEPSCVPREAKPFFISMVISPLGVVGRVAAPELPPQGAHLREAEPRATPTGRQGPELRDTWQRRSSHQQGGKAQGPGICGSARAHLSKEVRSRAGGHVATPKPTSAGR